MILRWLALIWLVSVSWCEANELVLKEYFAAYEREVAKMDTVLTKQSAAIAAEQIRNGQTADAASLEAQVKTKIAGGAVAAPLPAAVTLFQQYDTARAAAIKPHQAKAVARIDSLIKDAQARSNLKQVVDLGKAKSLVESGQPQAAPKAGTPFGEQMTALTRRPWSWATPAGTSRIEFKEDGTFEHSAFKGAFAFKDEKTVLLTWGTRKQELTFDFGKGEYKGSDGSLNQEIRGERTR